MTTKRVPHRFSKSMDNSGEQIGGYMSVPVLSIDCESLIQDTAKFMHDKNIGSLLVKKNEDYIGIVTERDLTRKVLGTGLDSKSTKVSTIMSEPIFSLEANRPVEEANKFMAK